MHVVGRTGFRPDTPSSVVALSVVDGGGRYSAPVLRLESTHELLSADLDAKTETHWFGEVQYIELKRISFVRGHTYRAELSYDRLRGEVSVSLFDLTTDRSIYSGFLYVNEYLGPLNAMAGIQDTRQERRTQRALQPAGVLRSNQCKYHTVTRG